MRTPTFALAAALILAACGGSPTTTSPSLPTAPTPTTPPAPAPSPAPSPDATQWRVTQTFVSVVGPDHCWVAEQRARLTGLVFGDLPMTVTRSGGTIKVEGSFFQVNYTGTFRDRDFSVAGNAGLTGGAGSCKDGTPYSQLAGVSNLSGTFDSDDKLITAAEVNSYHMSTGEPVTYTWSWQATRLN
jgi:hypothetical protein